MPGQLETVVDAAGDISQNIYDERFGTLLRRIQTVTDNSGNVLDYIVTVNSFSYVTDDVAVMSDLSPSGVQMPQTMRTYASFEVAGADTTGLRYSQLPDANSWTEFVTFDTSTNLDDKGRGQPILLSKRLTADGLLQTAVLGNYTITNGALDLAKPQVITTEIQTPDAGSLTGYDTRIQSTTYTSYDDQGRLVYSLVVMGADPNLPGNSLASGTLNTYGGPVNGLTQTQNVTATITTSRTTSNAATPLGTAAILYAAPATTTYFYYEFSEINIPGYQVGIPGSVWGGVKYSVDAAGQETYYAYDANGRPLLAYTYKQWSDANGNPVYGWVGTTTVYNSIGLVTDSYQATYIDPNHLANLDSTYPQYHLLKTVKGGLAGVDVDQSQNGYGSPASVIHAVHNDYNTLGQKIDSVDQYGGVTAFTYDSNGRLIRTVNPNGTETRTVYDAMGRAVWTTSQPFVPANGDPTSAINTAVLTHTIYNQLGQVVETDQVQGGSIEIVVGNTGSSVVWNSQEVGGSVLSFTKTFYDPAGHAIETQSTAANGGLLRIGTIYTPDGHVQYTGVLNAAAPDGGHSQTVNGITTSEFQLSDFASYSQFISNEYNSTLGLFYTTTIDQNGHHTDTYKDVLGRTVRTVYDDGSFTETLYSFGNQVVMKDQEGDVIPTPTMGEGWNGIPAGGSEVVTIAQRKAGDPLWITYDLYDAAGRLTDVWQPAVSNADPHSPTYGHLVRPHTVYTYDNAGDELTQTDANGHTTRFAYDQNGNQARQTLPDGEVQSWTYNASGQVMTHVDFKGQTTAYVYDNSSVGEGRPSAKYIFAVGVAAFDDGGNIRTTLAAEATAISYNGLGEQSEVDDYVNGSLSRQTTYTYDPIMQQLASTASPEGTIHYVYNAIGQQIETYTDNTDTAYGFDVQGRLVSVTVTKLNGQSVVPLVTSYSYDLAGNKTGEVLPNGLATTYTYDDLNRLTSVVEKNSANVTLFSQSYTLNSDGTRASSTENEVQVDGSKLTIHTSWTYDALDRLTGEAVTSHLTAAPGHIAPPGGLASWFNLPNGSSYSDFGSGSAGSAVPMIWDGAEYVTPGGAGYGAELLTPTAAVDYGGDGTDWVLVVTSSDSMVSSWSFSLSNGVLTPDGVVATTNETSEIDIGGTATGYSDYYTYGLTGNRMAKTHIGPQGGPSLMTSYTYNGNDELIRQIGQGETDFTYDPNGSLISQVTSPLVYTVHPDGSFGSGGLVENVSGGGTQINAQAVLPDGRIVVAGVEYDVTDWHQMLFLAEYNADGTLNTSFGQGGYATSDLSISSGAALSILPNGNILVAGSVNPGYAGATQQGSIALEEFHADGSVNTSFGSAGTGVVVTALPWWSRANAMTVLADGHIVIAGYAGTPNGYSQNAVVVEYNADGTLNTAFGSSGVAVSSAAVAWMSLVVLANGNLLVTDGSNLAEYDGTGHPVTGFGSGGIATTSMTIAAFQPLANGKILASGYIYQEGYVVDLAVERFNANGTLDTTFGVNGTGLSPVYDLGDGTIGAISVLASGEILVAGTAGDYNGNSDLVLTEFTAEGTLDVSFNYGIAFIPMGTYDTASAMTILPSGEILVGGELDAMNMEGFLAKYEVDSSSGSYGGGTQTLTYTYDVRGKLIGIARDGQTIATYTYDDQGNRVSETVGGVTTLYLIDTNNPTGYAQPMEAKSSATSKPITTWIIGDRVFGQADSAGNVSYLLADGHGSTRLLTSATGAITAAFNYDAFGTALNFNAGMAATPFLFGGDSFYDPASGLYIHGDGTRQRNGFWFMESDFGREGQGHRQDPLSLHKYIYVWGDPINGRDPSGHDLIDGLTQAGSVIASGIGDALGFDGKEVAIGLWEGAQAGMMAFADNFTFHQIGWLHEGRTIYWQELGMAGTSTETATNAAAWVATGAIDAAVVFGAWSVLGGIFEAEGAGPNPQIIKTIMNLADDATLTPEQIEALGKNVDVILEKSLPVKADAGAIQDIVDLFQEDSRFRFLDQVPGAWDSILEALDEYGYFD